MTVVAKKEEVPPGTGRRVQIAGKCIALFNIDGSFYAIDDACGHHGGPLSEGELNGLEVVCPWHGAVYDLRTGKACPGGPYRRGAPDSAHLGTYQVTLEGSDVILDV